MDLQPIANDVLERGILGIIAVVLSLVIVVLFRMLIAEKDKRRDDAQRFNEGLMEPIKQLRQMGDTQIALLQQFLSKLNKV